MKIIKKRLKNKKGQAAIFILMIFSLIFMFFGMAINIGMLVHHKINLQNAADLAALAGAAEEARILNMIGWKNYELRKNFKEFVYRYWVQRNAWHAYFPDPRPYVPRSGRRLATNLPLVGPWTNIKYLGFPAVPSFCPGDQIPVTPACDLRPGELSTNIPTLPPGFISIEPISQILLQLNYQLAQSRTALSKGYWKSYNVLSINDAQKNIRAFKQRAEALYDIFLNPQFVGSLPSMMNDIQSRDQIPVEWDTFAKVHIRNPSPLFNTSHYMTEMTDLDLPHDFKQLAEKTARNNLNQNLLRGDFEFHELTPSDGQYIDIVPQTTSFSVFATLFDTSGNSVRPDPFLPFSIDNFIVGVEKRNPLVFYGVMLKSHPDLPFLPGLLPWELTTVAAAKPFGGRIGPSFNESDYRMRLSQEAINAVRARGYNLPLPYLPIMKFDENQSINDTQLLHDLKVVLDDWELYDRQTKPEILGPLLSPNRWESRRYTFPDPSSTKRPVIHWTDRPFPVEIPFSAKSVHTGWAPAGDPPRAGYSIKLIPVRDIINFVEPSLTPELSGIEH